MNPLARDTVTLYMKHFDSVTKKDVWTRCILSPVIWTQKTVRGMTDGTLKLARQTSVTIDSDVVARVNGVTVTFVEPKAYAASQAGHWTLDKGFAMVYGSGANIGTGYTIAQLKADSDTYCTIQVIGDNTKRALLNHWQVEAV